MRHLLVFLSFLVPFLLRWLVGIEVYPAVLLPVGARRALVMDNTIPIHRRELLAIDDTGASHVLASGDASLLPDNIPRNYGHHLLELIQLDQKLAATDVDAAQRLSVERKTIRSWLQAGGFASTVTLVEIEQPARLNLVTGEIRNEGATKTSTIDLR